MEFDWSELKLNREVVFKQLYKNYFMMVRHYIIKNSGNEEDAHDLFQDSLIILFEKSLQEKEIQLECSIKTFIYSITRNLWLKKLKLQNKTIACEDFEQYIMVEDVELNQENETQNNQLINAMNLLGEHCRRILTAYYYLKKSMQEIADEMRYTNADNAKNQKYKCLQQLKKNFKNL